MDPNVSLTVCGLVPADRLCLCCLLDSDAANLVLRYLCTKYLLQDAGLLLEASGSRGGSCLDAALDFVFRYVLV